MKAAVISGLVAGALVSATLLALFGHQADWGWAASTGAGATAVLGPPARFFTGLFGVYRSHLVDIFVLAGWVMALQCLGTGAYFAWEYARDADTAIRVKIAQGVGCVTVGMVGGVLFLVIAADYVQSLS